jgi:hypothetical protein
MNGARNYRKRPVVVEALLFDGQNHDEVADFVMAEGRRHGDDSVSGQMAGDVHLVIHTLEGDMRADPGDYIIRGVQGEFYPCKPDIFAATYEDPDGRDGPDDRVTFLRQLDWAPTLWVEGDTRPVLDTYGSFDELVNLAVYAARLGLGLRLDLYRGEISDTEEMEEAHLVVWRNVRSDVVMTRYPDEGA